MKDASKRGNLTRKCLEQVKWWLLLSDYGSLNKIVLIRACEWICKVGSGVVNW